MKRCAMNVLLGCLLGATMQTTVWAQDSLPQTAAESPPAGTPPETVTESAVKPGEAAVDEEALISENLATAKIRYENLMKRRSELETVLRAQLTRLLDKYRHLPLRKPATEVKAAEPPAAAADSPQPPETQAAALPESAGEPAAVRENAAAGESVGELVSESAPEADTPTETPPEVAATDAPRPDAATEPLPELPTEPAAEVVRESLTTVEVETAGFEKSLPEAPAEELAEAPAEDLPEPLPAERGPAAAAELETLSERVRLAEGRAALLEQRVAALEARLNRLTRLFTTVAGTRKGE